MTRPSRCRVMALRVRTEPHTRRLAARFALHLIACASCRRLMLSDGGAR